MALILPVWIYFRNVGLEIFKKRKASSVVKTSSLFFIANTQFTWFSFACLNLYHSFSFLLIQDLCQFDNGSSTPPQCVIPEENTVRMPLKEITRKALNFIEEREIERVLSRTLGNKAKASRLLDIDYKTLLTKIKEYKIRYGTGSIQSFP
jgi:hypothetical protein